MSLTIEDIRNPARASGFTGVERNRYAENSGRAPFRAIRVLQTKPTQKFWHGPRRATVEEAAQDYCDYMNSRATPATPALKSAGHKRVAKQSSPAVQKARQALREALAAEKAAKPASRGYIYLVGEIVSNALGLNHERKWELIMTMAVKVGYSDDPPVDGRVGGMQTSNPRILVLLGTIRGYKADEDAMHAKYIEDNVLHEWFRPTPELFSEFGVSIRAKSPSAICVTKGEV